MTSNVELLPLPEWVPDPIIGHLLNDVDRELCEQYATSYARACVAAKDAEIEALRAERDLFRDETIELVRQNGEWQARAERLAEALRECRAELLREAKAHEIKADRPHQSGSDSQWHAGMSEAYEDAADKIAALHPTAAQENDDA